MADDRAAPAATHLAAVSDWHVFRLFVTVANGTEMPALSWTPAKGEPASVQTRIQHMIGWDLGTRSPLTLNPGDIPEGIITPTGTAYLYTMAGNPAQGGKNFRDVAELKDTVLHGLKQAYTAQAKPA
jgi:hypothetical protein